MEEVREKREGRVGVVEMSNSFCEGVLTHHPLQTPLPSLPYLSGLPQQGRQEVPYIFCGAGEPAQLQVEDASGVEELREGGREGGEECWLSTDKTSLVVRSEERGHTERERAKKSGSACVPCRTRGPATHAVCSESPPAARACAPRPWLPLARPPCLLPSFPFSPSPQCC